MLLLISLCIPSVVLLVGCISPAYSIEAHVEPLDPIVLAGTNFTISCNLDENSTNGHTSSDIVWYYKSSKRPIPSDQYHLVNDTTCQLIIRDISFEESGAYMCALASDGGNLLAYEGTMLYVGSPPASPSLKCHSNNILDYWCEWREGSPSNLRTSYTLEYRQQFGGNSWQNCPDTQTKGSNTCFVSQDNHRGYTQKVRVTATNPLGTAVEEITFNPDLETVPNPPSNVSVESRGSHSLRVIWELPLKWTSHFSMFLEYKLQYASEFEPDTWHKISRREMSGMRRLRPAFNIQNLEPYTNYHVRMSCKSMGVMGDKHWSDWTLIQTGMTDSSVPTAAVTALDWRQYSSHEEPLFKRDVFLQWKRLHRHQRRGVITEYMVNVMLQHEDGERIVHSENASSTVIFILGLEKYQDYYIQISACNVAGCGPNATVYLPDGTSEPGAPKNVAAQWQISNSVKMSWEMPSDPHGYVLAYNVQWAPNDKGAEWSSAEVNCNETSYIIKDLDPTTSYQFRVQTKNAGGYSGWTYSFELPDENGFFADQEATSRSAQEILKQAAQSLRDMMKLLQNNIAEENGENSPSQTPDLN
ncbi:cytokine receptor-like factor 1 [Amphiura filiformis]|uniref:cytokine receptor-like factor 1 n=1 Tax=Amphiura filiformis TaxID=82378 RepID=UPI003B214D9D